MDFVLQPWQLYFLILVGWINRQQQVAIDYLRTENQVLKEKYGSKRILLNDDQRLRLDNRLIEPEAGVGTMAGKVERRERLGGGLSKYF